MARFGALILLLGGLVTAGCWGDRKDPLVGPAREAGLPCASTQWSGYAAIGKVHECTLKTEAEVFGHRLPVGSDVWYRESGEFAGFALGSDAAVYGATLPAATRCACNGDGELDFCFLSRKTRIQGYLLRSANGHGYMTNIHPNGNLKFACLAEDTEIEGVPCNAAGGPLAHLRGRGNCTTFHPNGALRTCKVTRDVTIQGVEFEAWTLVRFDTEGRLVEEQAR